MAFPRLPGFGSFGLVFSMSCTGFWGCSAEAQDTTAGLAQQISGGQADREYPAVFGTVVHGGEGVSGCSATLIAPNLLLTARHCVSLSESESRRVICGRAALGEPVEGAALLATNEPDLLASSGQDWFRGAEIHVPSEGNDSCGFDIALVILAENVPLSVARPAVPRIDRDVARGERYVAVGYGLDERGDSGLRRQRADLRVACEPGSCGVGVRSSEFVGESGACEGDSGGPALDSAGKVVGVVSRSGEECEAPVYGTVTAWSDLITRVAQRAAQLGGYEAARWVKTGSSELEDCAGCAGAPGTGGTMGAGGTTPLAPGNSGSGGAISSAGSPSNSGGAAAGGSRTKGGGGAFVAGAKNNTTDMGEAERHSAADETLEATCSVADTKVGASRSSSPWGWIAVASSLGLRLIRGRRRK